MNCGFTTRCKDITRRLFLDYPHFLIVGAGLVFRVKHLAENRPFWLDECYVAVNITSRSFLEILANHDLLPEFARQPTLFSLIEKIFVALLGNNEMALRAFPFISGIGALILFAFITQKRSSDRTWLIGLSLFALSEPLVYFSAELKQYSTDLLCAMLLIEAARILIEKDFRIGHCAVLALSGALILWLSNAMIFVLAGIGTVILLNKPWEKGRRVTAFLCLTALVWLASFGLLYFVSLRLMIGRSSITDTWQGAFCTSPIFSYETVHWAWSVLTLSFINPAGLKWWWLMLPLFIAGVWRIWRSNRNAALLWLLPVVFTLLAALFGKYPFYGRVLLFLTASYFLFIAEGIGQFMAVFPLSLKKWLWIAILSIVFAQPLADAGYNFTHSRSKTDNRSTMEYLTTYYKPGDYIYLSTLAQEPFWYYSAVTGLSRQLPRPVIGINDGQLLRGFKISKFALDPKEINGRQFMFFRSEYLIYDENGFFRSSMGSRKDNENVSFVPLDQKYNYPSTGRTWLFISGPSSLEAGVNALILASFDKRAKRLLTFDAMNAGVYLFDMR